MEPFLRWAGGKRWLGRLIVPLLRERLKGRYIEPFLGSGAIFFALAPMRATLSDTNEDLINAFTMVARKPTELLKHIKKLSVNKKIYLRLRKSDPESNLDRAVRFLYLNRTCYGGLYRENKEGKFNVPYGGGDRTPEPLWKRGLLINASKLLSQKSVVIEKADFETSLSEARRGDVVYCDPTYRAATRRQFDRYGSVVFSWSDQERLALTAREAMARGAVVIVSNSFSKEIVELYPEAACTVLRKSKSIGHSAKNPDNHREYLFALDPSRKRSEWLSLGPKTKG